VIEEGVSVEIVAFTVTVVRRGAVCDPEFCAIAMDLKRINAKTALPRERMLMASGTNIRFDSYP
jgi:hypothetical protein